MRFYVVRTPTINTPPNFGAAQSRTAKTQHTVNMALINRNRGKVASLRFTSIIIALVNGQPDGEVLTYEGNPYTMLTAETDTGVACKVNEKLLNRAEDDGHTTEDEWEIEIDLEGEIKMGKAQFDIYPAYSAKTEAQKAQADLDRVKALQAAAKQPVPPPTETAAQKKAREKREAAQQAVKG